PNNNSFRKFAPNAGRSAENYSSRAFERAGSGFGSFGGGTSLHADSGRHGGGGHQDREAGHGGFDPQLGLGCARPLVGLRLAQWQQAKFCNRPKEETRPGGGPSPGRTG